MSRVSIFTIYGDPTPYAVELLPGLDGVVEWRIDADFAGRNVEEEIPVDVLNQLAGPEPFSYDDLLGLSLKTDGEQVRGLVGVGSGNEAFVLHRQDLTDAISALKS